MIYEDAHVKYGVSVLESQLMLSYGSSSKCLDAQQGTRADNRLPIEFPLGREEEEVLSGTSKIMRNGQEKNLWVNMAVFICLPVSVSHTPTEALTPRKNKKTYVFL